MKLVKSHRHENLICSLQTLHDGQDPNEWLSTLCVIATLHGVNPRVLDAFA